MLDLSPTKLIIIFIVVIVLLGPKRLPQVARQLGAGWRKLVGFQQSLEREIRENMPDLPSSQDIVRFARSPVSMLNQLAEFPSSPADAPVEDPGAPAPGAATVVGDASSDGDATAAEDASSDGLDSIAGATVAPAGAAGTRRPAAPADLGALAADDPALN